ncbi:MAG: hypothetical protein KBT12_08375 [Bacteroidales bacterium]|nr:hypothetical protein [Candidatus Physcousia equi]
MNNYSIRITYGEDIRSIDLEKILSGIRLIGEHELSRQKGKHVRNYTDCFRIKGVEKGSIIVNFNIDIDVNLNLILLLSCAITFYRSSNLPTLLKTAVSGIISAVKRGVVIHIKRDDNGLQDVEINGNFEGTLCIGKDGEIIITNNKQS